jgi:hypothetical protein
MKFSAILSALLAAATTTLASQAERKTSIYVQPVTQHASAPLLLAKVKYQDPSVPVAAGDYQQPEITSFELPELPDDIENLRLRVGAFNPLTRTWLSSTTMASAENLLGKGYSPTLVLSIDRNGEVLSVALKGVRIDAGQTRDFGPQVLLRLEETGRQPELNKPVVLSPDGKKPVEEEKTLLQK